MRGAFGLDFCAVMLKVAEPVVDFKGSKRPSHAQLKQCNRTDGIAKLIMCGTGVCGSRPRVCDLRHWRCSLVVSLTSLEEPMVGRPAPCRASIRVLKRDSRAEGVEGWAVGGVRDAKFEMPSSRCQVRDAKSEMPSPRCQVRDARMWLAPSPHLSS
ncbi:hypothetical protein E6O75_ATG10677 [Venturia nashicola]|uniref:Uncharacterized protein n=1 Tax=Venturia nashicola TaxID=86259 RepID=A0A4Z1NX54_9PEZI|nr:hypothetical protein E6O75_ATG10677 [Venturia nashicola]